MRSKLAIKISSGKYHTIYCDNCGKEIRKHYERRVRLKLEGRNIFCCNDLSLGIGKNMVIISHSPPRNTTVDVTFTGEHVGSISVREFIKKTRPLLVLCGHIHEAMGSEDIDDTIVVNPGAARHGKCAIIDLDEIVNVEFDSL